MVKAYSMDLRIRVINKLKEENITQSQVAKNFKIGIATVKRWVKMDKQTGSVHPLIPKVTRPRKIDYEKAKKFIEKNPDKTLKELGRILGTKDMFYVIKKLNITYKKKISLRGTKGRFKDRVSANLKSNTQR